MEPNELQPEPNRIYPKTTRTKYQPPRITRLGELEQMTLNVAVVGSGDTYTLPNGDPLSNVLSASP